MVASARTIPGDSYWLHHCEGFRVDSPDGRVGTVYGVRVDPINGEVLSLRTRTGLLRAVVVDISRDDVRRVDARRERVVLRRRPS